MTRQVMFLTLCFITTGCDEENPTPPPVQLTQTYTQLSLTAPNSTSSILDIEISPLSSEMDVTAISILIEKNGEIGVPVTITQVYLGEKPVEQVTSQTSFKGRFDIVTVPLTVGPTKASLRIVVNVTTVPFGPRPPNGSITAELVGIEGVKMSAEELSRISDHLYVPETTDYIVTNDDSISPSLQEGGNELMRFTLDAKQSMDLHGFEMLLTGTELDVLSVHIKDEAGNVRFNAQPKYSNGKAVFRLDPVHGPQWVPEGEHRYSVHGLIHDVESGSYIQAKLTALEGRGYFGETELENLSGTVNARPISAP